MKVVANETEAAKPNFQKLIEAVEPAEKASREKNISEQRWKHEQEKLAEEAIRLEQVIQATQKWLEAIRKGEAETVAKRR